MPALLAVLILVCACMLQAENAAKQFMIKRARDQSQFAVELEVSLALRVAGNLSIASCGLRRPRC